MATTTTALATLNHAATLAPLTWGTVSKKGITTQHVAHSATAHELAPRIIKLARAGQVDTLQLSNGNYSAVREAIAQFKGKDLVALQAAVTGALSQVQADGSILVPVIAWADLRTKSHAVAVARAIVAMTDLKGRKATFQTTMRAWVNSIDANMAPTADTATTADTGADTATADTGADTATAD